MSITDKLASAVPVKAGKSCAMCAVLEDLKKEDREAIVEAMLVPISEPKRITDRQLADILQSEGYDISPNSVYRHRRNHVDPK